MKLFTSFTLLTLTLVYQLLVQCTGLSVTGKIIDRLSNLNGHVQINTNLSVTELQAPSPIMQRHAECCVPKFKSLLLDTLGSVTVSEEYQHLTGEITDLLDQLHGPAQATPAFMTCEKHKPKCMSKKMTKTLKFEPFYQYKMYLQKLKLKRKRTA